MDVSSQGIRYFLDFNIVRYNYDNDNNNECDYYLPLIVCPWSHLMKGHKLGFVQNGPLKGN